MATIISEHVTQKVGVKPKYDWDTWLDGKTRRLTGPHKKGKESRPYRDKVIPDFDSSANSFKRMAHHAAKMRGFKVSVSIEPGGKALPDCVVLTAKRDQPVNTKKK